MRKTIQANLPPMGLTSVDQRDEVRSTKVDQQIELSAALDLLNRAVADCGYTLDALQAAMQKDRGYISKVLSGDKPLGYAFVTALPNDLEERFEQLRAEKFGFIVVKPATGKLAMQNLVSGLAGVLTKVS